MQLLKIVRYGELNWGLKDKKNYKKFIDSKDCIEWGEGIYSDWTEKYKESMKLMKQVKVDSSLETSPLECY